MQNLDLACYSSAMKLIDSLPTNEKDKGKKILSITQKALGVLQEDGVYAFTIYLKSLKDEIADHIGTESRNLLNQVFNIPCSKLEEIIMSKDFNLEKLLLTKGLLEKMLTYARYNAKGLSNDK